MKLLHRSSFDKAAFRHTVLFTLLLFFAAHAFCFFNLTFTSGSVMLSVSSGYSAQIESGQFLQPLYWRIRGSLCAPLLVGLLSALYLALTNVVIAWLLGLNAPLFLIALCGIMTVNPAVTSIFAASLNTADAALLGMLLAALAAACCLRMRWWGVPISAMLLVAAQGLETTALSFFAVLLFLGIIADLISARRLCVFAPLFKLLIVMFLAIALNYAINLLMQRRIGPDDQLALQTVGNSFSDVWLYPIRALFAPLTAYPTLSILLRVLVIALSLLGLVAAIKTHGPFLTLYLACMVLMLPILSACPIASTHAYPQITMAVCLLDVLPILLISRLLPAEGRLHRLAVGALGVVFLGSIVFSNQVYLKKNLEFESTLSLMSRVTQRIEEADGYTPGYTPVAIIGTPEDSAFSVPRKGFEHLEALEAARGNYAIATDDDMIWYHWMVMGYPLNLVSAFDLEQLKVDPQIMAMPAFPAKNCCMFVGDTLVVKLSDSGH